MPKSKNRVVIILNKGLVERVLSNQSGTDCIVLDKDTDGRDESEIQDFRIEKQDIRTLVENPNVECKVVTVDSIFNQAAV